MPSVPAPATPPATLMFAPAAPLRGCGTVWALEHRFDPQQRQAFDDGWGTLQDAAEQEDSAPGTEVRTEQVRSILTGNDSPDIGFELSINPYRGCEHVMRRRLLFSGSLQDE